MKKSNPTCEDDEDEYIDDYDYDNDDDDDICALCDGTGEGQFDGERCLRCRGRGY